MISLDRKKAYIFAIEKQVGTAPLSSVNIALTVNRVALKIRDRKTPSIAAVKRWYFDYQSDRRAQIGTRDGGAR